MSIRYPNLFAALALAGSAMATPSFAAESGTTTLTAYVPLKCSASLQPAVTAIGNNEMQLGNIRQFCNSQFEMRLDHAVLPQNSQLLVEGRAVNSSGTSTVLERSEPRIGYLQLAMVGADVATAANFASSIVVSMNALGL